MTEPKPDTDLVIAAPQRLQRSFTLLPETLGEARELAIMIANSEFAPKDYKGKPESVLIAIQMGADVGLRPMQALQNIAVINGRPSIWGDGALALTMTLFDKFEETFKGTWPKTDAEVATSDFTAVCTLRRRGWPSDTVREFSVADAKKAGLWGKAGPWTTYPKRMLQMRCRSWALRDAAADRLMGLILAEEAMDIPEEPRFVGAGSTEEHGDGPEVAALLKLPEALQERIEKGFAACNLTNGLRRAKLKEHLLKPDTDLEEQAAALLKWLEDEYAKRKTGAPVQRKKDTNGKGVREAAESADRGRVHGDATGAVVGAGVQPVANAVSGTAEPATATPAPVTKPAPKLADDGLF